MSLDNVTPIDSARSAYLEREEHDEMLISDLRDAITVQKATGTRKTILVTLEELDALYRRIDGEKIPTPEPLPKTVTQAMEVVDITIEPDEPLVCHWCGSDIVEEEHRPGRFRHTRGGVGFHPAEPNGPTA